MALSTDFNLLHGVGALCIFCGVILHIVGLATPSWTTVTLRYANLYSADMTVGLWEDCDRGGCSPIKDYNINGAWRAAGGFAILGMLSGLLTLGLTIFHVVMPFLKKLQFEVVTVVTLATSIVTLLLIIISISCYGGGVHKHFPWSEKAIGYSLILSIIGGLVTLFGGIVFYFPSLRKSST